MNITHGGGDRSLVTYILRPSPPRYRLFVASAVLHRCPRALSVLGLSPRQGLSQQCLRWCVISIRSPFCNFPVLATVRFLVQTDREQEPRPRCLLLRREQSGVLGIVPCRLPGRGGCRPGRSAVQPPLSCRKGCENGGEVTSCPAAPAAKCGVSLGGRRPGFSGWGGEEPMWCD